MESGMITIIPIEPLNDEHHDKIIAVFHMLFINRGGQPDGDGYGVFHGYGNFNGDGGGHGNGGKGPEAWQAE